MAQQALEPSMQFLLPLPRPQLQFRSLHHLLEAMNNDIKGEGYALVFSNSWKSNPSIELPNRAVISCESYGQLRNYRQLNLDSRQRLQRTSKKTGCRMHIKASFNDDIGVWEYEYTSSLHNHEPSIDPSAHVTFRQITPEIRRQIARYSAVSTPPRSILAAIQQADPNCHLILRDIYNAIAQERVGQLNCRNVAEALIIRLRDSGSDYFWREQYNRNRQIINLFVAHDGQIRIFKQHYESLIIDCTYKTNKYGLPLLNMIGVTGNNSTVQLGVVFLPAEDEQQYFWAMQTLKEMLRQYEVNYYFSLTNYFSPTPLSNMARLRLILRRIRYQSP